MVPGCCHHPWTLEDARGPGEAGEGVRGKRGGHGEEEEDGETVRLWRGCWLGSSAECVVTEASIVGEWQRAGGGGDTGHQQSRCRGPALYCTAATCVPARTTHRRTRRQYSHTVCRISAARSTAGGCSFLVWVVLHNSAWPVSTLSAGDIVLLHRLRNFVLK